MIEQPDSRLRSNETQLDDDEMVCDNCAKYPDMPQRHSKDEMWDALKDGGECVSCMRARIEGLRKALKDGGEDRDRLHLAWQTVSLAYSSAVRERDEAREEVAGCRAQIEDLRAHSREARAQLIDLAEGL